MLNSLIMAATMKQKFAAYTMQEIAGEPGAVGNPKEFAKFFKSEFDVNLRSPLAYVPAIYKRGHHEHKFVSSGYLILISDALYFISKLPKWSIRIPLKKIDKKLFFVGARGFSKKAFSMRDKTKLMETLESLNISTEGKRIITGIPYFVASAPRGKFSKRDVEQLTRMTINIAKAIKKRNVMIPYTSGKWLEKPVFYFGLATKALNEFVYLWAKQMLGRK